MTDPVLRVERLVAGGDGLARESSGRVVFVSGAVAGDRVRVTITDSRRDFARAEIAELIEPGESRVDPPCPHVADGCGGCSWQHIDPAAVRGFKAGLVAETMRRVGKFDVEVEAGPVLPSSAFRSTVRAVRAGSGLGLRRRSTHDPVRISACLVAHPLVDEVLSTCRLVEADEVTVRASPSTGQRLAVVHGDSAARLENAPEDLEVVTDGELRDGHGAAIRHVVAGCELRVSASSFFQTSHTGAEALVAEVRRSLEGGDPGPGTFADLYGGVGLFAATLAADREVVLVEANPQSASDAVHNLADKAVRINESTVEDWTPESAAVVVADPPRAGLGRLGAERVAATGADLVVLVSCDAASGARDVAALCGSGYSVQRCVSLGLFAHTHHVEIVTTMTRT